MLNTHHVNCFLFVFEGQGLMFTIDGRPAGEKGWQVTATLYSMPCWSTVKPVVASAPLPPRLTLALPGHHNPWGPFRGITGGCVVGLSSWWFSPYPRWSWGSPLWRMLAFLTPLMNRFSYCFVVVWSWERVGHPWGARRGFVTALYPSVLFGWSAHIWASRASEQL